jgi:hypothetical protein
MSSKKDLLQSYLDLEKDLLQSYFTEEDIEGLTQNQFQIAMMGLIEQGLMEVKEVNGQKMYRATSLTRQIKTHLNSNEKDRN